MKLWIKIIAAAVPSAAAFILLSFLLIRCRSHRRRQQQLVAPQLSETAAKSRFDGLHAGINKLHLSYKSGSSARSSLRFHHLHHHHTPQAQAQASAPFSWNEHPRLIAEAVESGWPRFAFSSAAHRHPSAPLWALCPACDGGAQRDVAESAWEVPAGCSEFMQTVRLNPDPMKPAVAEDLPFSCSQLSLPLPGPALSSGAAFPQEAYFEITILCLQPRKQLPVTASKRAKGRESDRAKLIRENSMSAAAAAESPSQESAAAAEEKISRELAVILGLTSGIAFPANQAMPGTYPGSIGFHSDGSVYLDGRKLVSGSEKAGWGSVNRVIGCGFEPRRKKVFFTVDSHLAQVIRCSSEAYSSPHYPVLAAANGSDAMLLVNLGQAPFKYAPANAVRTPNPCFLRVPPHGDAGGDTAGCDVDSRELFSVARLESEREERGRRRSHHHNNYSSSSKKSRGVSVDDAMDYDEAESDLFEISLQR